jgi:hypothetical protein
MSPPGARRITFLRLPAPRSLAVPTAVAALLALFGWLAVSASRLKSQTSDELPHLAAGYAYDHFGDFRIQPENGNLPQRVFGLASLAENVRFPTDEALWRRSAIWDLAWDYLYALDNPTDRILFHARALNTLFGIALGLLIFAIARAQWGNAGGLLTLAFYALAPNFLAHSALATSDVCAAFFLTLAPWLFWRHLGERTLPSGLLAALASGLTLVAKFNGVLLAPIYALLVVADVWLRPASGVARPRRLLLNVALAGLQGAAAVVTIWAFFNFRFATRAPEMPELVRYSWAWEENLPGLGWKRPILEATLRWHVLPEAWLYGLGNVLAGEGARPAFFAGEHSPSGWWQFFPALFLLKTPLATLGALLVAIATAVVGFRRADPPRRRAWLIALCPLGLTALVVGFIALRSHLNIGDRHILAIYPFLFVALGILVTRRALAVVALVFLVGQVVESFAIRPHYMASFNALAGGPANGYRLFVDSSLDWGQDLPTLRTWLEANRRPSEKLYLGYFGSAWPPHYGVRPDHFLPAINYIVRPPYAPYEFEPGLYCVSATVLAEVYSTYRGRWTTEWEQAWQKARAKPPSSEAYKEFDYLRFARLCKYLQLRTPDAEAGYSILIYRLSATDLNAALDGPVTGAYHIRGQPP